MNQKHQTKSNNTASKLDLFTLGYEYDKTNQEIAQEVRNRTLS